MTQYEGGAHGEQEVCLWSDANKILQNFMRLKISPSPSPKKSKKLGQKRCLIKYLLGGLPLDGVGVHIDEATLEQPPPPDHAEDVVVEEDETEQREEPLEEKGECKLRCLVESPPTASPHLDIID